MDLESLLTDLNKAELKLFRKSSSALNYVPCFSRTTCMSFFFSLIELLDSAVKLYKKD